MTQNVFAYWPNRITAMRFVGAAVLFVLLALYGYRPAESISGTLQACFWLFIVTALTDALDGWLARRNQEVTAFGRIADPFVDKILILGALVFLAVLPWSAEFVPAWIVVVVLAREILVTAHSRLRREHRPGATGRLVRQAQDARTGRRGRGRARRRRLQPGRGRPSAPRVGADGPRLHLDHARPVGRLRPFLRDQDALRAPWRLRLNKLKLAFVSFGFLGCSPFAPGTVGTLGGVLVAWLLAGTQNYLVWSMTVAIALYLVGRTLGGWAERYAGKKDPGIFVVDEVIGYLVTIAWIRGPGPVALIVAFFVFRFFDILKPPLARRLERIPGGDGIILDDVVAGLYGLGVMALARWLIPVPWDYGAL